MAKLSGLLSRPFLAAIVYAIASWVWLYGIDILLHHSSFSHSVLLIINLAMDLIFIALTSLLIYLATTVFLKWGQEATARLAAIVEGSEDAIIAYRLEGIITDWNQAATRLYGYSAEEAIGHNVSFLESPSHANKYQEMLKTIAAGGRFQSIEGLHLRRDGSPVAVLFSIFPITGKDGAIIGGS
jgi:PAS domain S-box-containing protein